MGAKNVLTETFRPKVLTEFFFWNHVLSLVDRGWAAAWLGLGWIWLGGGWGRPGVGGGAAGGLLGGCWGRGRWGLGAVGAAGGCWGLAAGWRRARLCPVLWGWAGRDLAEIGLLENGEVVSRPEKTVSRWPTAASNFYLFLS